MSKEINESEIAKIRHKPKDRYAIIENLLGIALCIVGIIVICYTYTFIIGIH